MELSPLVDVTLRVIHDIATVIWLGGMIIYVSILLPTLRKTVPKSAERKKIMQSLIDTLAFPVLVSMVVLFVTGLILIPTGHEDSIFLTFVNDYATYLSIKTYLSLLMFILAITKLLYVDRIKIPKRKHKLILIIISSNILIGIAVLAISIYLRYLI